MVAAGHWNEGIKQQFAAHPDAANALCRFITQTPRLSPEAQDEDYDKYLAEWERGEDDLTPTPAQSVNNPAYLQVLREGALALSVNLLSSRCVSHRALTSVLSLYSPRSHYIHRALTLVTMLTVPSPCISAR